MNSVCTGNVFHAAKDTSLSYKGKGGINVFVTGQQEVHTLCRKLQQTYPIDGFQGKSM